MCSSCCHHLNSKTEQPTNTKTAIKLLQLTDRHFVTFDISALEIFLLTYLLTYLHAMWYTFNTDWLAGCIRYWIDASNFLQWCDLTEWCSRDCIQHCAVCMTELDKQWHQTEAKSKLTKFTQLQTAHMMTTVYWILLIQTQFYLASWVKQPWNMALYFISASTLCESHFSVNKQIILWLVHIIDLFIQFHNKSTCAVMWYKAKVVINKHLLRVQKSTWFKLIWGM